MKHTARFSRVGRTGDGDILPINRSWLLRGRSANLDSSCLPSTMDWPLSCPWRKHSCPGDSPNTSPQALIHDGGGAKMLQTMPDEG